MDRKNQPNALDALLTTAEAAAYLGNLKPGTLEVWRCTGRYNLAFVRIGNRVRYRRSDLDRFLAARTVGEPHAEPL